MVHSRNHAGALLLILTGVILYSWNPDPPAVGSPTLALVVAGLLWGGLVPSNPLRERRPRPRSRSGSLRVFLAPRAGHRRHRGMRRAPARRFAAEAPLRPYGAGGGVAMYPPATVAVWSFVKASLRVATQKAKEDLCGAWGSMWALLSAIVLALTSSKLLLTDRELSLLDRSEVLYVVVGLAVDLGLLVTGLSAADSVAGGKGRTAPDGVGNSPAKRGALLLGEALGVMAAWLLVFVVCVPYILVAGFGTGVSWAALIQTFVLGTLCVAGFVALIVGIGALSRSGRGARFAFLALFVAMASPTPPGNAPQEGRFGDVYSALSPVAQARLSLRGVISDKESLLAQLPHIGALGAFAAISVALALLLARGFSPERVERRERGGGSGPRGPREKTVPSGEADPPLAGPDTEESVRL